MRLAAFAFAAALALAAAPSLAAGPWVIDKQHAQITFAADHLGFSVVQGRFREFDADILFDPEDIAATEIKVVIQTASVDTGLDVRDTHIRSSDFLDAAAHPEITFVSTAVRKTAERTAEVTGDLTLAGETRRVTFEAVLNQIGPSPFNPSQIIAGFVVTGEIERSEWGITFGGKNFAAVVPVRIDLEMSPAR